MESILSLAWSIVVALLVFGITIFVHELGHFLVARWCGLQVDAFSVGFGPALWKKRIHGVLYKIGILPLGGYVALPQLDPTGSGGVGVGDSNEEQARRLPRISPGKKILVSVAGVTCNMILAYLLAWAVYLEGRAFDPGFSNATIGYLEEGSAAAASGLAVGDVVSAVNGEAVSNWEELMVVSALNDEVVLSVQSVSGDSREVTLPTEKFSGVRMLDGIYPMSACFVLGVRPDSPAKQAGLASGDRILAFNGVSLYSRAQMIEEVNKVQGTEVPMTVERDGATFELLIAPEFDEELGRALIGIEFYVNEVKKPMDQVVSHATLIFRILKALVTPSEAKAAAEGIGGPVLIIDMLLRVSAVGLMAILSFACLLNVNLAVLNLLPLPVLDGGHIVLSVIEGITRKPVSPKVVTAVWNVGTVMLLALFLTLTFKDIRFIVNNRTGQDEQPAQVEDALPVDAPTVSPAP